MEHHSTGIPTVVIYQAINFFGLLAILHFLLRKKVVSFFNHRHETVKAVVGESKRLKDEAEKKHQEYNLKFQMLESEAAKSLEKIKQEGEETKKRIIEEAQKTAAAIEAETKRAIQVELSRAKKQIFEEALDKTLNGARELLVRNVKDSDQQKLEKDFINQVGGLK